jgi:nicotinamidase/pyrazinamidase
VRTVLWDVDTQVDFVLPDGKLAVPGAVDAAPAMARLVEWGRANGVTHVASADDHELTDPEISDEPDFQSTYPPHCLRGTRGAQKIPEILLLKKSFDVFTSPNAEAVLEYLDPTEVVVFGVATDVCNHAAIIGLVRRGRRVAFVEDAARGLDDARTAACLAEWRDAGVRFTTSEQVVARDGR